MEKPKLRFKNFESSYRTCLLNKCLEVVNKRNVKLNYGKDDALSVSDEEGVVNQIQHLGRSYTGADVSNYKILEHNQIVYTKSPLKLKPFGIVKSNSGDCGIVSVLYAIYKALDGIDANYINYYFEPFYRINNYLRPLISKGAKNTINISDDTALLGTISIPQSFDEQYKVAFFFRSIDKYISDTQHKILSLKKIKLACLQSMFPQEGQLIPKVRFKGFDDAWKLITLKDIAHKCIKKNTNKQYTETFTNSAELGVLSQRDYFDHDIAQDSSINGYYLIEPDDFVYNPRISATAPVGPINRNQLNRTGVMSPLYLIFKVEHINKSYLSYFFKTNLWHKYMFLNGNSGARFDRLSITDDKFFEMPILVPPSLEEQRKLAVYFENIDQQISLQNQRLEKLKNIKVACLDNMFV